MDIPLTQRLSFKQAGLTVLVAFILGTLLSVTQVAVDYASEEASINREIRALLEISHNPAARIAYNIDAELAQELVLGLLRSPAVTRAELIDSSGLVLASVSARAGKAATGSSATACSGPSGSSKTHSTSAMPPTKHWAFYAWKSTLMPSAVTFSDVRC